MDARIRECIDRCRECETLALEAQTHCLARGGRYAEPAYINLMRACVEVCGTTARIMLLRSEFHVRVCEVCAFVCEALADDTESKGPDEVMRRMAEACRRCAESCREMAVAEVPALEVLRQRVARAAAGRLVLPALAGMPMLV